MKYNQNRQKYITEYITEGKRSTGQNDRSPEPFAAVFI